MSIEERQLASTTSNPTSPPGALQRLVYSVEHGLANLRARWALRSAETLGARARLWGSLSLRNRGRLRIGERTRLVGTLAALEIVVGEQALLEIGERVYINYGTSIGAFEHVRIGDRCNIGSHVTVLDNNQHHVDPERRLEQPPSAPVVIDENVWVGSRVIVLPGVHIGADSVIGAGSVVTGDIPPRSVAFGVPARVVREV